MAAMLNSGAWLIPLLLVPLGALQAQVLPDPSPPPGVDMITPVPPPPVTFGTPGAMDLAMPKELKINNQGGTIEGNIDTGIHFGGPVKIEGDNGLVVFANTAVLDLKTKAVTLNGAVSVYQGNVMQRGEHAVYYYERKFLDARDLRASMDPLLLEAGKFTTDKRGNQQVMVGEDAGITTDDEQDPGFWMRAKQTTIYPEDRVVFKNMWFYVKDTPVFWLPYLSQPLNADLGYHFVPGARSHWGTYLLNTYGIMLGGQTDPVTGETSDAWLLSRWHLDLRTTRGVGTGVDFVDTRVDDIKEISGLRLSYLDDLAPETSTTGIPRGTVNPNRYAAQLKYRIIPKLPDDAAWRIDTNLTLLSDPYYLEDFDIIRYRTDPAPDNTLGIYRRDDQSLLSLYARFQVNDYYRADTRLPEVTYDRVRSPLFGLPVLHEGNASLGLIGQQTEDITKSSILNPMASLTLADPAAQQLLTQLSGPERTLATNMLALPLNDPQREVIRSQLLDSNFGRFNTYQALSMPMMLGGFLSLVPEAGIGYSRYFAVDGPEGDSNRTQLHVGAESSLKFSKDLGNYQSRAWGLDGMMHVCQPYANWSVLTTNNLEPGDPMVDRLTPTTRPRPMAPIRFTATDEMQSWNVLRLGARNRLLTKRDNQNMTWLYLDTYLNAFVEAPSDQQAFSNIYNDVQWLPLPWLNVGLSTEFPIESNPANFSEINSYVRFMPTDSFELTLGTHWLDSQTAINQTNLFDLQTYTRLNEKWGFGTHHTMEFQDSTLEYQQYTIHRDLGSWVAGLGATLRNNRLTQEYGLVFTLTLKAFPSVSLPFEMNSQQ